MRTDPAASALPAAAGALSKAVAREEAVEHDGMEVWIDRQGGREPLDDGDGAGLPVGQAQPRAIPGEDHLQEDPEHTATQVVVVGKEQAA
ncbi:MAG: hypothetical protein ABIO70_10985 [Pseudomonadota bacterium]